jgi:general secretion pathway protein K
MSVRNPKSRRSERGIALIMVVIAIAILTAVATEFAYTSRVDLEMAANMRDEMRASYLAKSGIGLARLLLKFQGQLDNMKLPNMSSLLDMLSGGAKTNPAGGATAQPQTMSIQLWRMARIDCHMLRGLVTEDPGLENAPQRSSKFSLADDEEAPEAGARKSFGAFEGCFLAQIEDEEGKININKLNALGMEARNVSTLLYNLLSDKRFEFLYEKEDANRVKVTAQDQILAMRDWIDDDESGAALNLSTQGDPFSKGFSDENGNYSRYSPTYKAKNAYLDTLDELYMVHGVNDRFMAAFRDRLTVYPDINANINVNSDDPIILYMAILAVSDPIRPDPRLKDPIFVDALIQRIRQARVFAMFGMSAVDFTKIVQAAGVAVNSSIANGSNRAVSDKSKTFTIRSTGEAGNVQKTLTAVVRIDNGLGRLLYWREE